MNASGEEAVILGELLCARLCHDLAGAVGAVGTGVELLTEDDGGGEFSKEALALVSFSAQGAVHRLKFLRIALGATGGAMTAPQLKALAEEFLASSAIGGGDGIRLDWRLADDVRLEGGYVKLLLNLILLARDCLLRGGILAVEICGDKGELIRASAEAPQVVCAESAKALTASSVDGLGPRGAQGYYTSILARRIGLFVNCEENRGKVVFVTRPN